MKVLLLATALFLGLGYRSLPAAAIVAHRGASHAAPENTLASQRLAWAEGADAVETDIHLTRDGRIIVLHDANCRRTTGRDAEIADLTFAEARTLDAGKWKDARFAGERLPSLDEQLALVPEGKRLLVEIKTGPEIVPELARVLAHAGAAASRVTAISFNFDALRAAHEKLPAVPTLWLVGWRAPEKHEAAPPALDLGTVIARARAAGFTGLDLQHTWPLTAEDVRQIRAAGLQLHVWTVDDAAVARHWVDLGVDSLTTNRPAALRRELAP